MMWIGLCMVSSMLLHVVLLVILDGRLDAANSDRRLAAHVPQVWSRRGSKEQADLYAWIFSAKYTQLRDGVVSAIIWPLRVSTVFIWLVFFAVASVVVLSVFQAGT